MSDLTTFRDHARAMSEAEHKPDCVGQFTIPAKRIWKDGCGLVVPEVPAWCHGCVTPADRALWARLADEADAYLNRHIEEGLFQA